MRGVLLTVLMALASFQVIAEENCLGEKDGKSCGITMAKCGGAWKALIAQSNNSEKMDNFKNSLKNELYYFHLASVANFMGLMKYSEEKAESTIALYSNEEYTNVMAGFELALAVKEDLPKDTQIVLDKCKNYYLPIAKSIAEAIKE